MLFYSPGTCQGFRIIKFNEKFVYVREFVFVSQFNRKSDDPHFTDILIHKRDHRQHIHQTG